MHGLSSCPRLFFYDDLEDDMLPLMAGDLLLLTRVSAGNRNRLNESTYSCKEDWWLWRVWWRERRRRASTTSSLVAKVEFIKTREGCS